MGFWFRNKKILVLVLLLVVTGGVILAENSKVGQEFFDWIKSTLFSFKGGVVSELLFFEEPELDVSEVNLEGLLLGRVEEKEPGEETPEIVISPEPELPSPEIQAELARIQGEIDGIREKTNVIEKRVNELKALSQIQKELDGIAEKIDVIGQRVTELV